MEDREFSARVTITNNSRHDEPCSDDVLGVLFIARAGQSTSHDIDDRDVLDRLTPALVQLDARDDFDVDIEGA